MNTSHPRHAQPRRFRSRLVIAAALCALALPGVAQAHGAGPVIALDYDARPAAGGAVAPGVRANVMDGDRKLELRVGHRHDVTVIGYGGEPFLHFSARGVEVNERSLTAVTNRLARAGSVPALSSAAHPTWEFLTTAHRFAWHDHRLGPRPGERTGAGRVGTWSVPVVVDGAPGRITGQLWRAHRPALAPWLALWGLAVACGCAIAWRARRRTGSLVLYACTALSGALVILVGAGFTLASSQTGSSKWIGLAAPAVIASLAIAVFVRTPRHRFVVAALAAALAFADALEDAAVFRHGYVVSELPAGVVRASLATALAAGAIALIVALTRLFDEEHRLERSRPGRNAMPRPKLAIPKGKMR